MKTLSERRVKLFVDKIPLACSPFRKEIEELLILELKQQDKRTRHACAEAVLKMDPTMLVGKRFGVEHNDTHRVIMNTKAV